MKTPRAYQAYWDYDYLLAEIGRFLDLDEEEVLARLDDSDLLWIESEWLAALDQILPLHHHRFKPVRAHGELNNTS